MSTGDAAAHRPMRADARRNYQRLLTEADTAFAERGADASLEDIARRAGVGIGTLYRHFPTRTALLEAVYVDRVEALHALAKELAGTQPADQALTTWLRALLDHHARYRGLKGLLLAGMADPGSRLSTCSELMQSAATELLDRAQRAGAVRSDLQPLELLRVVHAAVVATEHLPDRAEQADRLLSLMMDGLRGPGPRQPPTAAD